MRNEINVSFVYDVENQIFNLGEDGPKTAFDPRVGKSFIYASSANIKHCFKNELKDALGVESPHTIFSKKYDKTNINEKSGDVKEKQGGVCTEIDVTNPMVSVCGAWNSDNEDAKYRKVAIRSALAVSAMRPIHPYLANIKNEYGVCVGDENSSLLIKNEKNKGRYTSPEELANGEDITMDQANSYFKNVRRMNLYSEKTASGIYISEFKINVDAIQRYNLTENPYCVTDDELNTLLESGKWYTEMVGNQKYLVLNKEDCKTILEGIVNAMFSWEFESNRSLHGEPIKLLRVSITGKDPARWHQATYGKPVETDGNWKSAKLVFHDNVQDVYSYNTMLVEQYAPIIEDYGSINTPSIDAHIAAKEKILEIGSAMIDR